MHSTCMMKRCAFAGVTAALMFPLVHLGDVDDLSCIIEEGKEGDWSLVDYGGAPGSSNAGNWMASRGEEEAGQGDSMAYRGAPGIEPTGRDAGEHAKLCDYGIRNGTDCAGDCLAGGILTALGKGLGGNDGDSTDSFVDCQDLSSCSSSDDGSQGAVSSFEIAQAALSACLEGIVADVGAVPLLELEEVSAENCDSIDSYSEDGNGEEAGVDHKVQEEDVDQDSEEDGAGQDGQESKEDGKNDGADRNVKEDTVEEDDADQDSQEEDTDDQDNQEDESEGDDINDSDKQSDSSGEGSEEEGPTIVEWLRSGVETVGGELRRIYRGKKPWLKREQEVSGR